MIITLIKMLNVDSLSSQMSIAHYQTLMYEYTLVDLYLFMWRETVDLRVAEWIFCLVHFQHYLAFDKEKVLVKDNQSFRSDKCNFWFSVQKNHAHESSKTCLFLFFFRKLHCFSPVFPKVQFFVVRVYSAKVLNDLLALLYQVLVFIITTSLILSVFHQ